MRKQNSAEYRGYRTAGIRLSEELLPDVHPPRTDGLLPILLGIHLFDKAHLTMLAQENLIPMQDAAAMLRVLRGTEREGFDKTRIAAGGGIHSAENLLIRRLGEDVGGRIQLGRSSNDQIVVAIRIAQRDGLLELMACINGVRVALLDSARQHVDTVMPGYTQGQQGQPITLGHYLASWGIALERDFERAIQAYRRINDSPAGTATMAGSDFPLNRHSVSEWLGFDRPSRNAYDSIMNWDQLQESFCVLALLNSNIARWADDMMVWSSSEFGMVEIPDRFCGTSSIMMQKKNAYALEHMKGLAAQSAGGLMTALLAGKGPSGWPVVERRHSADSLWRLHEDTLRHLRWWQLLVPALQWNVELMRARSERYWAQATDIAGALVREKGLSWRTAHQIVGILVRYGYERGFSSWETTCGLLDEAAIEYMGEPVELSEASLRAALDARHFVEARTLYGGPASEEVRRRIEESRRALGRDEAEREAAREAVKQGRAKLEAAIDTILAQE